MTIFFYSLVIIIIFVNKNYIAFRFKYVDGRYNIFTYYFNCYIFFSLYKLIVYSFGFAISFLLVKVHALLSDIP